MHFGMIRLGLLVYYGFKPCHLDIRKEEEHFVLWEEGDTGEGR